MLLRPDLGPQKELTVSKLFLTCVIAIPLLVFGCYSPLSYFTNNMYAGNQQLKQGQYSTALASFLKANTYHPSAGAYAFAAMAAYKMNDIPLADNYLVQATRGLTPNQVVTCIIYGYRSLVRFSQGNDPGGRQELIAYIAAYRNVVPGSATLREVEFMAMAPQVDTFALQKLIDQQIQQLPIDYDQM
jgi:hypothetical protein